MTETPKPAVVHRKVQQVGDKDNPSYTITIPRDWVEQHGVKPKQSLMMVSNRDLRIVAPGHEGEIDSMLHEYIRGEEATREEAAASERPPGKTRTKEAAESAGVS